MKRLVSAVLALSLLGGSAAVAAPNDYGHRNNDYYGNQDRDSYHRDHRDNNGGAVVAGLGFLTLAAILASQHNHHRHYYGYDRGYDRGYDNDRYDHGYDRHDRGRYSDDGRHDDHRDYDSRDR